MGRERGPFRRPHSTAPTKHLLVANCGNPSEQQHAIRALFCKFDQAAILTIPPDASVCFVTLATEAAAAAAQAALNGTCSAALGGHGPLVVAFAERRKEGCPATAVQEAQVVAVLTAAECSIPGLSLLLDFVSPADEAALVQLADAEQHWSLLAKRRVLHWGHVFDYEVKWSVLFGVAERPCGAL